MATPAERVAELEWANYAAMLSSARVTPGLEVNLREDVIITSTRAFPTPDTSHACLLRSSSHAIDLLINEVTDYFQAKDLPVAVYVSPACSPDNLSKRLSARRFKKLMAMETWMVLEDLPDFDIPTPYPGIEVRRVGRQEIGRFAEVFMAAFSMPTDYAPAMARLLGPSADLPQTHHYLAFDGEQSVGTCSLLRYETFGVLGSTGVSPDHRRTGAATNLAIRALTDARDHGVETIMLQTEADTWLERLLHASGFRCAFNRSCYVL